MWRWMMGRLYRKLILSHVLVLLALFVLMGGVLRLFYVAYVDRALRERFWAQTTLLLQRLESMDQRLHYARGGMPAAPTKRPWWKRWREWRKDGAWREPASTRPRVRGDNDSRRIAAWLGQAWVQERLRAWSLLLNARVFVHDRDVHCWLDVMPRRFARGWRGGDDLRLRVGVRVFARQRCPRRLRRMYRRYRRHPPPHWILTRRLRVDGVGEVELTFLQMSPVHLEGTGFSAPLVLLVLFLGLVLLTIPISRNIGRPLRHLMERVRRIPQGDLAEPIEIRGSDEVADLARTIDEMRRSLLHLHEQRAALLSDISHEMRTPLARIRMVAESVADGLMREAAPLERAMEGICVQVDEVNQMLGDLLELARFEVPSKQLLEMQSLDLGALLEERRQHLSLAGQSKHVRIVLKVEEPALPSIQGDARRIKQVVNNLVQNALRYSPENGEIRLRVVRQGGEVCVEVADQGPGIPEGERERVFERFVRLDASRSRKTGHQGLGLAIVKQLVESHGGRVGVREAEGGGACFWFTLPMGAAR